MDSRISVQGSLFSVAGDKVGDVHGREEDSLKSGSSIPGEQSSPRYCFTVQPELSARQCFEVQAWGRSINYRNTQKLMRVFLLLFALHLPMVATAEESVSLEPVDGNYSQEVEIKDFEELDLEELLNTVYTAARHEQNIFESPSAITVITREQIENTHCTDVICLLRQVPEVDVRRVLPGFIVVGARAMTEDFGNKTLVMVDGREINQELFGVALWQSLPIHLLFYHA